MATNVTVTESHVNDRQYAGGDNYYSFTSVVNEGDVSAGVEWLGDTPNAVGTYAGESSIKANEELLFDGSTLYPDASGNVALGKATETFTEIHVANLYATAGIFYDYVYIADLSTAISQDSAGNMTFYDAISGSKTLAELIAGDPIWEEDSEGNISPVNSGSDILLATNSEHLKFGDGDTKIFELVDDTLLIVFGVNTMKLESGGDSGVYFDWLPLISSSYDLGDASYLWRYLYTNSVFFETTSYRIGRTGTDLFFTSPDAGTVYLSDLENFWEEDSVIANAYRLADNNGSILLPYPNYNRIKFGDGDTYIYETIDDELRITTGGGLSIHFTTSDIKVNDHFMPYGDKSFTLGSTSLFWGYAYVSRLYVYDTSTYLSLNAGNLQFTDANTGTKTLAELVAGAASDVWQESSAGDISPINSGSDILLAMGTEWLKFGDADTYIYESSDDVLAFVLQGNTRLTFVENSLYASIGLDWRPSANKVWDLGTSVYFWDNTYVDRLYIDNVSTYIDVSGTEMSFTDATSGTVTLSDMISPWNVSGTNIVPATSGNDILLAVSTERISFGDGDTQIYENADDELYISTAGSVRFFLVATGSGVASKWLPNTTKTYDLGSSALFWDNTYVDRLYVDNINTYIDIDSSEMTFTDTVSGTKKLSELVGSGASSPLTTKGDVWGFSTVDARIPVGTDGYALVADSTEALGVKWGVWGNVVYDVTLTDNTTTNITVGDTTNNRAITVKYSLVRDTDYRSGTIDILNSGGVITDDGGSYFGDSCGLTVSADASGGNIRLNCLLTSTGDNATFEYVLIYPDYSTSTAPASYTHPNHSGHVTSVGDGAQTLVVAAITGQTALTSGLVSTDELLVNDVSAGTLKRMDISVIEAYMQANLTFGGSSLWTDNGTSLSPASGGHDLLLAVSTERIIFGDGDTYIYEQSGDTLWFVYGGVLALSLASGTGATFGSHILPDVTKSNNVGSASLFWDNGYFDRLYIDDAVTYIDISSGDMTFTDAVTGTKTLAELASSGGSYWTDDGSYLTPSESRLEYAPSTKINVIDFNYSGGSLIVGNYDAAYAAINGYFQANETQAEIGCYQSGTQIIRVSSTAGIQIVDNLNSKGMVYNADYSAAYTNRSLVDKEYVDNAISGSGGDVTASGTLTDNVVMVGDGGSAIDTPDATVSFGGHQISSVGMITSSGSIVATGFHAGALNRVSITSTALPAMSFHVASVTKLVLNGSSFTSYVDFLPYTNKDYDIGSNTIFWANAYIDKVYFGSVDNNITEVGSDMTFTDDTAGTATLQELYTGGTVNYTTIDTHTPTKYYKHLNVYYSGGSTGTINVDLDAYELSSDDSMVTISYYVSAPPGVTINIRDSSNSVIFTVSNGGSIIQASKILVWDNAANTWRVVI